MSFQNPDFARTPDSRSIRLAELRRTVERAAPEIDQSKALSDAELAELERARSQRQADKKCAEQEGRAALRARLHRTVERLTGSTPAEGTPLPA